MAPALRIAVEFPLGYGGSDSGDAEEIPTPARLYDAFVAAAAGGPGAEPDGEVLVATEEDRLAVAWLERNAPMAIAVPATEVTSAPVTRYRRRASPVTLVGTLFEARCALGGAVTYLWPPPDVSTVERLSAIAREITHVGRGDSLANVRVELGSSDGVDGTMHEVASGRGPGRVLRVPAGGRFATLARRHRSAARPARAGVGNLGKQAPDLSSGRAGTENTDLLRFIPAGGGAPWPFDEVWTLPLLSRTEVSPRQRVAVATAVHRALVAAIREDVPPLVTGRTGDGPQRGPGHLAIHVRDESDGAPVVLLAIPSGAPDADVATLGDVVEHGLRGSTGLRLGPVSAVRDAREYWGAPTAVFETEAPMVLDVPGVPRRAPWSLADSVVCSVGYALRHVLETELEWGTGWGFRRELVDHLQAAHGVAADARRLHGPASPYVHRASPGDLLVAVRARVDLGALVSRRGGLLALGRARHMGGGLLRPEPVR